VSLAILRRRGWIGRARPADDVLRLAPDTILARGRCRASTLGRAAHAARRPPSALSGCSSSVHAPLGHRHARGRRCRAGGLGVGLRGEQVAFIVGSMRRPRRRSWRDASARPARRGRGRRLARTWIGAASCLV
jgi:hypothetical protein